MAEAVEGVGEESSGWKRGCGEINWKIGNRGSYGEVNYSNDTL